MTKVTLKIDGMMCGMCEAHVNDAIRKVCEVKKVTSSHTTGVTEILLAEQPDVARIKAAVKETGYKVTGVRVEPYEKKGFSLFRK